MQVEPIRLLLDNYHIVTVCVRCMITPTPRHTEYDLACSMQSMCCCVSSHTTNISTKPWYIMQNGSSLI